MPTLSEDSMKELSQCHTFLRQTVEELVVNFDVRVLEGRRSKELQNRMVRQGKSQLEYPESKHNYKPAMAVDLAPYPIQWNVENDAVKQRWLQMHWQIRTIATRMGVPVRSGIDWDMDADYSDHNFHDYPHVEIDVGEALERGVIKDGDFVIPDG